MREDKYARRMSRIVNLGQFLQQSQGGKGDAVAQVAQTIEELQREDRQKQIRDLRLLHQSEDLRGKNKKLDIESVMRRASIERIDLGLGMDQKELKKIYSFRSGQRSKNTSPLPRINRVKLNKESNKSSIVSLQNGEDELGMRRVVIRSSNNFEFLTKVFFKISGQKVENLANARIMRYQIRSYLLLRYQDRIVDRFLTFFEVQSSYDINGFKQLKEQVINQPWLYYQYLIFFIYDLNEDRLICNTDLFRIYTKQHSKDCIEKDVLQIYRYVKEKLNKYPINLGQIHQLQRSPYMRQINLSITQLRKALKSKVDVEQPKTDVKRNTVFLNNFGAKDFFLNQNMDKLLQFKELINDKKPFHYKSESAFSIHFNHFLDIFSPHLPHLFIDLINYLGMGEEHAHYQLLDQNYGNKQDYTTMLDQLIGNVSFVPPKDINFDLMLTQMRNDLNFIN